MLRPSYSICVLSGYTSTPIVCCLRPSEVGHNIFSHCPEKQWGVFQRNPPLKQVNLYVEADTRRCVHKAGGVSGKTLSIYLSASWQRTELTSMGFPRSRAGGLYSPHLHARSMPRDSCYLQITLFENSQTGRDMPRYGFCQLPSQQLAIYR